MIKLIEFSLTSEDEKRIKNKEIDAKYLIDNRCKVVGIETDSFTVIDGSGHDGSRFIIINGDKDTYVARYSSVSSWHCYTDLGIDLVGLLIKKIKIELGFERVY